MKKIRSRLTYANVMSSIAVFLVLGGATAFAATKIGANEIKANSILTGKIKKEAVTTAKIKNEAVNTPKIKNNAVNGAKVDEASLGQVPSAKTSESASNVLWAVVNNPAGGGNATVVRSSQPAPTVQDNVGADVIFQRNVSGCAWTATRGVPGEGVEVAGFAEVGGTSGNPNGVDVRVRNDDGGITDGSFHLVVVCP